MTMNDVSPNLGELITDGELRRDAVHIAVAPMTASVKLHPGERIGLMPGRGTEYAVPSSHAPAIGIVDPFLLEPVKPNQRFWCFLLPNTITGLRHIWSNPAFSAAARENAT